MADIERIENDFLSAGVKYYGSELTSVKSKKTGMEFIWCGDTSIWYGQSPILFPIVGRLLDDKYMLNGKEYSMPKHGLYRKRNSTLVSNDGSSVTFMQTDDDETFKKYPFHFDIYVKFQLEGKSLKVTHTVVNKNDGVMYFSIGAHPAFNCHIGDKLIFEKKETLSTEKIDSDSIRLNEKFPLLKNSNEIEITKDIFKEDALILSGIKSKYVTLNVPEDRYSVKFDFNSSPYLGIWAKPGAPYVCIEPWWGVNDSRDKTDDFSKKDEILSLDSGKKFEMSWQAYFDEQ